MLLRQAGWPVNAFWRMDCQARVARWRLAAKESFIKVI